MSRAGSDRKKELQGKYVEFQAVEEQMKEAESQLQKFEEHAAELESIKQSLDDIRNTPEGTEILVPVSQGIFVKASIKNPDDLIVNVGGNAAVEKDAEGTKNLLDVQLKEIEKARSDLLAVVMKLSARLKALEGEISKIAEGK